MTYQYLDDENSSAYPFYSKPGWYWWTEGRKDSAGPFKSEVNCIMDYQVEMAVQEMKALRDSGEELTEEERQQLDRIIQEGEDILSMEH